MQCPDFGNGCGAKNEIIVVLVGSGKASAGYSLLKPY
jgi:hypothetical protein